MDSVNEIDDQYINPKFNFRNADRFYVRKSIVEAITDNKKLLKGKLLDVGCGIMPYKEVLKQPKGFVTDYMGVDFEKPVTEGYASAQPDLFWDGSNLPMVNNQVDSVLLTEVLEHCFEPKIVLNECFRVLKSEGNILITVPFVWPLHDIPFDAYRYTPYSLEKLLQGAGFKNIRIKALGGWNASLGQMMGLWINRSEISGWRRRVLYFLFFQPFMRWLYKTDQKPKNFHDNAYMYTGLLAYATK